MCCNDNCKPDRPSVFVNHISRDALKGCNPDKCSHDCSHEHEHENLPCDCKLGHIGGGCVHYTGHSLFLSQIKQGETIDEVIYKLEEMFSIIDKTFEDYEERIKNLESEVEQLKDNDRGWIQ